MLFSTALLPERLSVSCDSENTANIAYVGLKVKPNRKSPYFRAFSRFVFWIKNFSSPKMQNRQFVFAPKIEYELVAERSEANLSNLQFPMWCRGRESNSRLLVLQTRAPPLSYPGRTRGVSSPQDNVQKIKCGVLEVFSKKTSRFRKILRGFGLSLLISNRLSPIS